MNERVYVHEYIDIILQGRAKWWGEARQHSARLAEPPDDFGATVAQPDRQAALMTRAV